MPTYARRVASFGTTIFSEINELAQQYQAINLGQGRPDFDGPPAILDAAVEALLSGNANQYPPGMGILPLRQGIADHALRYYNLTVNPDNGIIVTAGATQAIFSSIMGLVDEGDEVIVIEPFFDSYVPNILMAGAKPIYVALHPPEWRFDEDELRTAFSARTRAILLNTPHNPTGRVFDRDELTLIANLCKEFDVIVISDEVYEHLVFQGNQHIPIASLPDMFERTVTIGSAGKTFGMTGWKIGWVYGPEALITGVWRAHQFTTFAANHPAQVAIAHAFTMDTTFFEEYQSLYTHKRELMMRVLDAAGLSAIEPQGTYFVMANFADVFDGDDIAFSKYLITEIGVAGIPPSFFYSNAHKSIAQKYVRFAFCKNDNTLLQAAKHMEKLIQNV